MGHPRLRRAVLWSACAVLLFAPAGLGRAVLAPQQQLSALVPEAPQPPVHEADALPAEAGVPAEAVPPDGQLKARAAARSQRSIVTVEALDPPQVDVIIQPPTRNVDQAGVPIYVGYIKSGGEWQELLEFLPQMAASVGGAVFRINCTQQLPTTRQTLARCHQLVASAALAYWGGMPGTYMDLETNVKPAQRADYALVNPAARMLLRHRDWHFIHFSRYPALLGLVNPQSCALTPFYEWGSHVYRKLYSTDERTHAMLCHTDFARHLTDATFPVDLRYDLALDDEMRHVVYPAVFQRRDDPDVDKDTDTYLFEGGFGRWLLSIAYTPWVFTTIDFFNARGAWILCLCFPVTVIVCLTSDLIVSLACFAAGFVVCWALGFR